MEERNKQFAAVIDRALTIARERLANYGTNSKEPLTKRQLETLVSSLEEERDEVLTKEIEPYVGQLFGPLKPVIDWGEPDGSEFSEAIHQIEVFYSKNF